MLYLIYCESSHYCGYGQHFVAEAESAFEAEVLVQSAAEDYFMQQDYDQLVEDGEDPDSTIFSTFISTEEFGPEHNDWQFYMKPDQAQFYLKVNVQ